MQLDRGPAGVQRPPHRAGREPVDGRPAARLHVGDQLQPPGQLRLQRPGRDRGQVGLQQHVVDRLGQQPGQRLVRLLVVAGQQVAGVRRQPVEPGHPEHRRLGDRPQHLVGAAARPARPLPAQQRDHRRHAGPGGQAPARGQRRQRRQRHRAGLGHVSAGQLGRQRVPRLAGGVARADQPGHPRAVQPGAGQPGPALGRRPQHPGVDQVGRQPHRVADVRRPRWPAGRRPTAISTSSASGGLVDVQRRGGRPEVADAEPAAAQRRRRLGAPLVEQQLEPAYRLERRARRRRVDLRLGARRSTPAPAPRRPARRRRVPTAQGDPDLAGDARPCRCRAAPAAGGPAAPRPGVAASSGSTVCRASSVVASPPAARTCSSIARAGSDSSASLRGDLVGRAGVGAEQGRSPLTPASGPPVSPSATPLSGRSPPVDSQASARSTSRPIACPTAGRIGVDHRRQRRM